MAQEPPPADDELLAKAKAAVSSGDDRQAIGNDEQLLQRLHEQSEADSIAFRGGAHADLLMAAARHAVDFMESSHVYAALGLIRFIAPRFANSEKVAGALGGMQRRCIERALYNRGSPRASDVLLCCSEADRDELQSPLAAALRDLGVLVAAEPLIRFPRFLR